MNVLTKGVAGVLQRVVARHRGATLALVNPLAQLMIVVELIAVMRVSPPLNAQPKGVAGLLLVKIALLLGASTPGLQLSLNMPCLP